MAFNTYSEGLRKTSDLANKAIQTESSLSSLGPLTSPLPILQRAFQQYITAAQSYSHLLFSSLVPSADREGVRTKWRLVLSRAEKIKARVEGLGGQVGKALMGDEGEEELIRKQGGLINGIGAELWATPTERQFEGEKWTGKQPALSRELEEEGVEWVEVPKRTWEEAGREYRARQGRGADCSVVTGLAVCMEHNRRWGTKTRTGAPRHSENGKHVVRLLLNGAWRGVMIDALLPRSARTHWPCHPTAQADYATNPGIDSIGSPWFSLVNKAYFLAVGGYDIAGSDPAPDVYALTGWIPERISLRDGFQREKAWKRIYAAWVDGKVLVTLGSGQNPAGLVPHHAYAVFEFREDHNERLLEVFDPGISRSGDLVSAMTTVTITNQASGSRAMTWDEVCNLFDTINLNWNPDTRPVSALKHWSWPKPDFSSVDGLLDNLRYRLTVSDASPGDELWILLSQHIVRKDRSLDDIALYVFEETGGQINILGKSPPRQAERHGNPLSNAAQVLVRYPLQRPSATLLVMPVRDRGFFRTNFTLSVHAMQGTHLLLERISQSLPFSQVLSGKLTTRNAGGHSGWPSWMNNPQYKITISPQVAGREKALLRLTILGNRHFSWNAKIFWEKGRSVCEATKDNTLDDSGPYTPGVAYLEVPGIDPGVYTLVVSAFEPGQIGDFKLSLESSNPFKLDPIAPEGAGMFSRLLTGTWTENNAGGRPSSGTYDVNPQIELILPRQTSILCRLLISTHPRTPIPINLTFFRRATPSSLGDQITTSGPYSDTLSGVTLNAKLEAGVYIGIVSAWDRGLGVGVKWETRLYADSQLSAEVIA